MLRVCRWITCAVVLTFVRPLPAQTVSPADSLEKAQLTEFLDSLTSAIAHQDTTQLICLSGWPLRVNLAHGQMTIKSAAAFKAKFGRIFTPAVRAAILHRDTTKQVFRNYRGYMISHGTIWFDHTSTDYSAPGYQSLPNSCLAFMITIVNVDPLHS